MSMTAATKAEIRSLVSHIVALLDESEQKPIEQQPTQQVQHFGKLPRNEQLRIWREALVKLQKQFSREDYDRYIRPLRIVTIQGNHATINAMSVERQAWVFEHAYQSICQAMEGVYSLTFTVEESK